MSSTVEKEMAVISYSLKINPSILYILQTHQKWLPEDPRDALSTNCPEYVDQLNQRTHSSVSCAMTHLSYLISLNPIILKNIAHVGYFKHACMIIHAKVLPGSVLYPED